jgi:hypothetical protein
MSLQGFDLLKLRLFLLLAFFIVPATMFAQEGPVPTANSEGISYGLVIDNSGSFRKLLEDVIQFVEKVTDDHKSADEAFFVRFVGPDRIKLDQEFTSSRSDIMDSAEAMYIEAGQTALIDAVRSAGVYFLENARPNGIRSVILVTDGDDRASISKPDEAIKILKDAKIRVFAVAVSDEKVQTKFLERLTRETGGKLFTLKSKGELRTIAGEVAAAIRKP